MLQDLAANDELLQVTTRQAAGERGSTGRFDVELLENLAGEACHAGPVDQAPGDKPHPLTCGQEAVLGKAQVRDGGLADALLGYEHGTERAALHRADVGDLAAKNVDRASQRRPGFARKRAHQLDLTVARNAGNANNLARAHREIHAIDIGAVGLI